MTDSATPWTAACQAPLSMGFFKQEYGSGLSFPPLGDFPTQGLNSCLLHGQANSFTTELPGKPQVIAVGECLGLGLLSRKFT